MNVPTTPETKESQERIWLRSWKDHYHELIEQGKSEHEAIGAVISEFGSIDELLQELQVAQSEDTAEEAWLDAITIDEAFDFWGRFAVLPSHFL